MKKENYIVQARREGHRPLQRLGVFYATDATHAILQAAQMLARCGDNACEFVATLDE